MVYTPHIGRVELYKTSGHYPYYEESQFPTMQLLREIGVSAGDRRPARCREGIRQAH